MQEAPDEIKKQLEELKGWELKDGRIVRSYEFDSFLLAVQFVNDIAKIAEERNHHPVITVSWKTVKVSSISFDVEHLTERDIGLAKAIDAMHVKKYVDKLTEGNDLAEDEYGLLSEDDEREKARLRTRGPYRKSSSKGL